MPQIDIDVDPKARKRWSYITMEVLPELKGLPWNDTVQCVVEGLKPGRIRTVTDFETSDARPGRVTVYLKDDIIIKVVQELDVPLPDDCQHGHALQMKLKFMRNEAC